MDLALRPEDVELASSLDALLTRASSPARVRAAEKLGFDADLWQALTGFGVPDLAAGAEAADLRQLVIVAEQAGRHLASAPVVESLVTARLLDRCPGEAAAALLDRAGDGAVVTLLLHPSGDTTIATLVPAGAVADTVISYDGASLTAHTGPPPLVASPNLGSLPLADRELGPDGQVLSSDSSAAEAFARAQQEWQLLTAAQLVGAAGRALEIGVAYVKDRVIFDKPVGSFQTVAHRLADHATDLDGARLLVSEAAWAADVSDPRASSLATMAFCFAAERALAITGDCLHYHGGYGFSLEYDIQLYYRRTRAYPLVWGSVQQEYQALADRLFGERTTA